MIQKINEERLTHAEREEKLAKVKDQVKEYEREYDAAHKKELNKKEVEFWEDARDELEYTEWLTEQGVYNIENKAYADGHAYGYSSIYEHLQDLVEFLQKMRPCILVEE